MKLNAAACMAPPFDTNPLTIMWCLVTTSQVLVCNFTYFGKLAEMAMVQIVGSVEDEHCFFTLALMKSKLRNKLTTHLPLVVWMFAQWFYTLQNFLYVKCIEQWQVTQHCYFYDG
jgi:D-arabinose 5-phosphate isomerase GutQ